MKKLIILTLFLLPFGASAACQEATMTFKQNGIITQFSKTCVETIAPATASAPAPLLTNETIVKPQLTYTEVYVPEDAPIIAANPALSAEALAAIEDSPGLTHAVATDYVDLDGKPVKENNSEKEVLIGIILGMLIVALISFGHFLFFR